MNTDPIVEEICHYRKKHAEKYNNDLNKIFEALKKDEKLSNRKLVNLGSKLLLTKTES